MRTISIIGCGNIGSRHLQSCLSLEASTNKINVLEPQPEMVEKARDILEASDKAAPVSFVASMDDLPDQIDVAIVATSSDVRKDITLELLAKKQLKFLILEKFLFQYAEDYEQVGNAIAQAGVPTYVNCPTRIWPVFQALAEVLRGEQVASVCYEGVGSDIGCNGIHKLDLLSFLVGSEDCDVEGFELQDHQPAKREGYLKLGGVMNGTFTVSGNKVPFVIDAPEGEYTGGVTTVELANGSSIVCRENGPEMIVSGDGVPSSMLGVDWSIPYQSALTAKYVEDLTSNGRIDLPTYDTSKTMHLLLLSRFLDALNAEGILDDPKKCPVT